MKVRTASVLLVLSMVLGALPLPAAAPRADVPIHVILPPGPTHDHLVGEVDYGIQPAGKFLNIRLTLIWEFSAKPLTGHFSCKPRRGLREATGQCPLSQSD